jgi:hypothetical protein
MTLSILAIIGTAIILAWAITTTVCGLWLAYGAMKPNKQSKGVQR